MLVQPSAALLLALALTGADEVALPRVVGGGSRVVRVARKQNNVNAQLPFGALPLDDGGAPLKPESDDTWDLFVAGKLALKQPLPQTLRVRQATALASTAARGLSPFPGPLLSPPQAPWESNLGATKLLVAPERVLQEIDAYLLAQGGALAAQRSTEVVNIGAAVLPDQKDGGFSGDGQQEYCHRLYELGYSGPAFDPSEEGLLRLKERYPSVTLVQGYVTPTNVVRLLADFHAGAKPTGQPAAASAAAAAAAAVVGADGAAAVAAAAAAAAAETAAAAAAVAAAHPAALVKIDIDAYDCAVLGALLASGYRPFVLVVEINFDMPPPLEFAVHYSDRWAGWKDDCHYGCSVAYATRMVGSFGYVLLQVDGWDAVYVRAEFAPLFGAVPHDAYTVQALRPPMVPAEPLAGWVPPADGSPVADWMAAVPADGMEDPPVYSHCRQVVEVFYNLPTTSALVQFSWAYALNMSHYKATVPFVIDASSQFRAFGYETNL